MSTVKFTFDDTTSRYKAEFFKEDALVDWKYLSNMEAEALEEFLSNVPAEVDAVGLYEELDNLWFATPDGEPSNFEEMLFDLVQDEIDE